MPEPLFDNKDRVDDLPEELKGKTPAEIVKFYQERETNLQRELKVAKDRPPVVQPAPAPAPAPDPTSAEFWTDPARASKEIVAQNAVSKEEFTRLSQQLQSNFIETARMIAKDKHPDWAQWEPAVQKALESVDPWGKANPQIWEIAYYHQKGMNTDRLVAEAETRGRRIATEPPTPPPPENIPITPLSPEELRVADQLNLTQDQYRESRKRMEEGTWPMTMNNLRRK